MLCQFFVSVGLRKHGDPLVLAWNQLVGRAGTLELGNRTHNEKVYNDVKKFLDPPEQSEAPAQETEEIPF
jgi:hypothetical protein